MRSNRLFRNIAITTILTLGAIEASAYITHEVQRGETLWGLSHKYNVSADDIIALNPSVAQGLKAGTTIKIPDGAPTEETVADPPTPPSPQEAEPSAPSEPALPPMTQPIAEGPVAPSTPSIRLENPIAPATHPVNGALTDTAKFGDTFYSISKKTGVPVVDLLAYNPTLDIHNLREGTIVRLSANAPFATAKTVLTAVDSIVYRVTAPETAGDFRSREKGVAVMLPFDLTSSELSKQSLLATEFYKGFLMALNENANNIDYPLHVVAVDTQTSDKDLLDRLSSLASDGVSVIVPPDDERQVQLIEDFALDNNLYVLNVLNVKDEGYLTNPRVVQCNISQKLMYDKAIDALLSDYDGFTPVVLDLAEGKDEKRTFIDELRARYRAEGKEMIDLSFAGALHQSHLSDLDPEKKYIFIPKSGSVDVFDKFSQALAAYMENDTEFGRVKLFGYPDWVTFRGSSAEMLHRLGAVIYSRFCYDPAGSKAEEMNANYRNWYGAPPVDVFPSQGILGYDAGNLFFRMLNAHWLEEAADRAEIGQYDGIQSAFRLIRGNGFDGIINDALFIIEFLPGSSTYVKVI